MEPRVAAGPRTLLDGERPVRGEALDQNAPTVLDVEPAAGEHRVARGPIDAVDEVAREQDALKTALQVEDTNVGQDLLGAADVLEHLGGVIHSHHRMAELQQRMRDSPGAAPQVQHGGARRNRGMHERRLVPRCQAGVELTGLQSGAQ